MKTLSTDAGTIVDAMNTAPIRLVIFEFSGVTVRLCSRVFGTAGSSLCVFASNLYEPLLLTWGSVRGDSLHPRDYSRTPSEAEFTVDNTVPVGGYNSFSALFGTEAPAYSKVTVKVIYEGATASGDEITEFVGKIESLSAMRSDAVTVHCSGIDLSILTQFPADYVSTDLYPNAAEADLGKMLPVVWGQGQRVPLRCLDSTAHVYGIAHAVQAVDAVYDSDGTAISSGFTAYTGQSGDELSGYSSMCVVDFTSDPGDDISADIDGYVDDGSGTYTGSASSLIERPDHILRHLLYGVCPLASTDVDDTSYDAAGTGYDDAGYTLAVVVTQTPSLTELIRDIAFQCKSLEFWEEGKHHIVFTGGDDAVSIGAATVVFGGGHSSTLAAIDYIDITTPGNAADFGDLSVARYAIGAASNGSTGRAIFGGGYKSATEAYDTIDRVEIGTPGNAADFGDLSVARKNLSATSNGTTGRGIFGGGLTWAEGPGPVLHNEIDYVAIGTPGNATDFGDLTSARRDLAATSNGTTGRGVFCGGNTGSCVNTIDYVEIGTPGNATDFGDLAAAKDSADATSTGTGGTGFIVAGSLNGTTETNEIEYISIGAPGNSYDWGDVTTTKEFCAASSNGTGGRAVESGGDLGSSSYTNVISYWATSSAGNSEDFGDLTSAKEAMGGASNA